MKISVIGTINYDHIFLPDEPEERTSFGGILYNSIRLAVLFGDRAEIYPVSRIGRNHRDPIAQMLSDYPSIRLDGLLDSPLGTNEAYLYFTDSKNRSERIILHAEPLAQDDIEPFLDSDFIHFNFISGKEVNKETFHILARQTEADLSMDIHNLIGNFELDGIPSKRVFTDWPEWVAPLEFVQMNETEASFLVGDEVFTDAERLIPIGVNLVEAGPRSALITLGKDGAIVVYRRDDSTFAAYVPGTSHQPVNTTGCGDAFSSGYRFALCEGLDPLRATLFANTVAGMNAATEGIGESRPVEDYWREMRDEYGELLARIESGWCGDGV